MSKAARGASTGGGTDSEVSKLRQQLANALRDADRSQLAARHAEEKSDKLSALVTRQQEQLDLLNEHLRKLEDLRKLEAEETKSLLAKDRDKVTEILNSITAAREAEVARAVERDAELAALKAECDTLRKVHAAEHALRMKLEEVLKQTTEKHEALRASVDEVVSSNTRLRAENGALTTTNAQLEAALGKMEELSSKTSDVVREQQKHIATARKQAEESAKDRAEILKRASEFQKLATESVRDLVAERERVKAAEKRAAALERVSRSLEAEVRKLRAGAPTSTGGVADAAASTAPTDSPSGANSGHSPSSSPAEEAVAVDSDAAVGAAPC